MHVTRSHIPRLWSVLIDWAAAFTFAGMAVAFGLGWDVPWRYAIFVFILAAVATLVSALRSTLNAIAGNLLRSYDGEHPAQTITTARGDTIRVFYDSELKRHGDAAVTGRREWYEIWTVKAKSDRLIVIDDRK